MTLLQWYVDVEVSLTGLAWDKNVDECEYQE